MAALMTNGNKTNYLLISMEYILIAGEQDST